MQGKARHLAFYLQQRFENLKHRFKRWRGYDPVVVQPYITYGTNDELWIAGRVLEHKGVQGAPEDSLWKNLGHMLNRYLSAEVPYVPVEIRLGREVQTVTTDYDGYFHYRWQKPPAEALQQPWTEAMVTLIDPELTRATPHSTAEISMPSPDAKFAVISDVDDTIMRTGATSFLRHTKTVLLNNAHSRELFTGTHEFYQALQSGLEENEKNPFFYVSSSPWNIFDLIADFIQLNGLPQGPVLLKDFGLTRDRWFKDGHESYKRDRIESVLNTYPQLPLVLIGDSGQRDMYAYLDIAIAHPGRILAVYIRDLKPDNRSQQLNDAAEKFAEIGVPFLFAKDAYEAAQHAAQLKLITAAAALAVKQDVAIQRAIEAAE